jgi:DNA gyrase/topoisomerase IV subunit A
VKKEEVLVSITQKGYVKRVSETTYRSQGRGGRGVIGQSMRDEDEVKFFLRCHTLSTLCYFSPIRAKSIPKRFGSFLKKDARAGVSQFQHHQYRS